MQMNRHILWVSLNIHIHLILTYNFYIMKKSILNIGTALTRSEQKTILGGSDWETQIDCEMGGGNWVCVGVGSTGACGCVRDHVKEEKHK